MAAEDEEGPASGRAQRSLCLPEINRHSSSARPRDRYSVPACLALLLVVACMRVCTVRVSFPPPPGRDGSSAEIRVTVAGELGQGHCRLPWLGKGLIM